MAGKPTPKQSVRALLASLRARIRSAAGKNRHQEALENLSKLSTLRTDMRRFLEQLDSDTNFSDILTDEEKDELRSNLGEMEALIGDLFEQLQIVAKDIEGCIDNAAIISDVLDRLDGVCSKRLKQQTTRTVKDILDGLITEGTT